MGFVIAVKAQVNVRLTLQMLQLIDFAMCEHVGRGIVKRRGVRKLLLGEDETRNADMVGCNGGEVHLCLWQASPRQAVFF